MWFLSHVSSAVGSWTRDSVHVRLLGAAKEHSNRELPLTTSVEPDWRWTTYVVRVSEPVTAYPARHISAQLIQ
jgi:hypothetical protein